MAEPPSDHGDGVDKGTAPVLPFDDEDDDDEEEAPQTVVDSSIFQEPTLPHYPAMARYGHFELLGRIALGGMAEIFLARDKHASGGVRHVVIKRVLPHVAGDEDFIRMFLDEAQIANRLYHPNVCHTYESGEIEGTYFMAMEWVHGVPLRKVIRRANAATGIPLPIAVKAISLVAQGLHYAHTARGNDDKPLNIVHRDVSPHNIMIGFDGEVKLLDFGIAKAESQASETQAGVIKGKYSYLAPEQCHGNPVDARSDVFSLGICLYETVTGRPLYHRGAVLNTMTAIVREQVPSARAARPDVPEQLDAVVQKALQKDPADRYQSAAELHEALEQFLRQCSESVDEKRISTFLDTLFEADERNPLSGANAGPGREGRRSQTPTSNPLAPESGSFGPFGQRGIRTAIGQKQSPDVEPISVDIALDSAPARVRAALKQYVAGGFEELKKGHRRTWAVVGVVAVSVAATVATLLLWALS